MITLTKIRELDLAAPAGVGRPRYLSAASGLVSIGTHLYIVADDELHLGVFPLQSTDAGHRCGSSREHCRWLLRSARRASPPGSIDCASTLSTILSWRPLCARLRLNAPASHGCPGRARPTGRNARRAVLCDLSNLFASLAAHFAALNIEGAVVVGDELCLLQRGGSRDAQNAMIFFRLSSVLEAFQFGGAIAPSALHAFELGDVDGIPLSFTDCAALPGGAVVFRPWPKTRRTTTRMGRAPGQQSESRRGLERSPAWSGSRDAIRSRASMRKYTTTSSGCCW